MFYFVMSYSGATVIEAASAKVARRVVQKEARVIEVREATDAEVANYQNKAMVTT